MDKEGQFYLLAAIIIVGVLLGMAGVTNYVLNQSSDTAIVDIKDELRLESKEVVNWGIFQEEELDDRLTDFANNYSEFVGEQYDVLFIYGDEETIDNGYLKVVSLFPVGSTISLNLGESRSTIDILTQAVDVGLIEITDIDPETNLLWINVNNIDYSFDINEGNNFYFIVHEPEEETA